MSAPPVPQPMRPAGALPALCQADESWRRAGRRETCGPGSARVARPDLAMMWLYDIPDWLLAVLVVGVAVGLSAAGLAATRSLRARVSNDVAGAVLGTVGLVQGVLLALVAVAAWNNYTAAGDAAEREAAAAANMFRQFEGYPEPVRERSEEHTSELQSHVNLVC